MIVLHFNMKNPIIVLLVLILVNSCSRNDFKDTQLIFETDKETYQLNDKFELTFLISPINKQKTIRLFKDLKNIKISFVSTQEHAEFDQKLKKRFVEGPPLFGDDSEYIDEFTITKEKPFVKTLYGTISELNGKIVFEIPELNVSNSINKSTLLKNPNITIKGVCKTIYGGDESFNKKEVKILIE